MVIVNEFTPEGWKHWWGEKTLEEARSAIRTLKISGAGHTFNIESEDGVVLDVIKMPTRDEYTIHDYLDDMSYEETAF